jgi:AbrB family transcriptional regulator (stage V sporulation protein T)
VAITDRDAVVAVSGLPKRELIEKRISSGLERIVEGRTLYRYLSGERAIPLIENDCPYTVSCAMPIITEGDVTGCVVSLIKNGEKRMNEELENKLIQTAAGFLSRQLES